MRFGPAVQLTENLCNEEKTHTAVQLSQDVNVTLEGNNVTAHNACPPVSLTQ